MLDLQRPPVVLRDQDLRQLDGALPLRHLGKCAKLNSTNAAAATTTTTNNNNNNSNDHRITPTTSNCVSNCNLGHVALVIPLHHLGALPPPLCSLSRSPPSRLSESLPLSPSYSPVRSTLSFSLLSSLLCVLLYIYIYIYTHVYVYIYIYTHYQQY